MCNLVTVSFFPLTNLSRAQFWRQKLSTKNSDIWIGACTAFFWPKKKQKKGRKKNWDSCRGFHISCIERGTVFYVLLRRGMKFHSQVDIKGLVMFLSTNIFIWSELVKLAGIVEFISLTCCYMQPSNVGIKGKRDFSQQSSVGYDNHKMVVPGACYWAKEVEYK